MSTNSPSGSGARLLTSTNEPLTVDPAGRRCTLSRETICAFDCPAKATKLLTRPTKRRARTITPLIRQRGYSSTRPRGSQVLRRYPVLLKSALGRVCLEVAQEPRRRHAPEDHW